YTDKSLTWRCEGLLGSCFAEATGVSLLTGRGSARWHRSRHRCCRRYRGGRLSTMVMPSKPRRPRRLATRSCLGPVADLEAHLPEEWWRKLFNALYVKTDGDVVENVENTRREVDFIISAAKIQPHSHIL